MGTIFGYNGLSGDERAMNEQRIAEIGLMQASIKANRPASKRGRRKVKVINMATDNVTPKATEYTDDNSVSKSVFDLSVFDDVDLVKPVVYPAKPATLDEAMAALNNDQDAIVEAIYKGICAQAKKDAVESNDGWLIKKVEEVEDGDDKITYEPFTGNPAKLSEKKQKALTLAVLNIAKVTNGYDPSMTKEARKASRENAKKLIRESPAMLRSIQGIALAPEPKTESVK